MTAAGCAAPGERRESRRRPFLSWTDPEPLAGSGHEYLAVDDWEAALTFDDLHVRPAP